MYSTQTAFSMYFYVESSKFGVCLLLWETKIQVAGFTQPCSLGSIGRTCDVLPQLMAISLTERRLYKEVAVSLPSWLNVSRESTSPADCLCFCLCVWFEHVLKVCFPLYSICRLFLLPSMPGSYYEPSFCIVTPNFIFLCFGSVFC